ncbi:MAG: hypothetical protein WCH98_18190, partial [Verrucomicrobiota bacterium]
LTKIETSAKSLLVRINDTLDYSLIESGKLVLEQIDFPLQEISDAWRTHLVCLAAEESAVAGGRRIALDYSGEEK